MRKYEAVIFDLDGTLMDTSIGVIKSVEYVITQLGLPPLSMEEMRSFIGPPIQVSFRTKYDLDDNTTAQAASFFRNAYKDLFLFDAEVYPGIFPLLEALQTSGIRTAVATYKREDYTLKLLHQFGLCQLFDFIKGSDFEGKLTKTDIVKECVRRIGTGNLSQAVLIGDTFHDANGAKECNIDFLGVTFGFGFKNEREALDAGATSVARSVEELRDLCI
ncbi:HAD hydrolase-like protein [Desulfitobacterium hafniense]|uniref:HAD hydrolase-like protein n=1 Tax=Desulfitobacterium hafniense TaxID=49338 RepID=UPI00037B026A|nr:HAD hydrolase-like protein [Desulfitobacterium hafniense]